MRHIRSLVSVTAVVVALALLAGCGSGTTSKLSLANMEAPASVEKSPSMAPAPQQDGLTRGAPTAAEAAGQQAAEPSSPLPSNLPRERMVIKTAGLSLQVKDVDTAFTRAVQLAEAQGAFVQSSSTDSSGGDSAQIVVKVPPQSFLPLVAAFETLGRVTSKSITGQDVTEEYYDLSARLENLKQVRSRLFQLLARAAKVTDAVEVERELERVGDELNQVQGRMQYLKNMVGLSTINLSLFGGDRPAAEDFINWSLIGHGFVVAARVLVQALFFILQALIVVIPLGIILGAAAWGIVRLVRFLRSGTWRRKVREEKPARRR